MDWQALLSALGNILIPIAVILIPYLANLLRRWINSQEDINRVQKLDTIAEGVLGLIMINNPKLDILENVDQIKDMLVAELINNTTIPLANSVVASRIAAKAIVKGQ